MRGGCGRFECLEKALNTGGTEATQGKTNEADVPRAGQDSAQMKAR
jgi:hypothetical protein